MVLVLLCTYVCTSRQVGEQGATTRVAEQHNVQRILHCLVPRAQGTLEDRRQRPVDFLLDHFHRFFLTSHGDEIALLVFAGTFTAIKLGAGGATSVRADD